MLSRGAQSCVDGSYLFIEEGGHDPSTLFPEHVETRPGGFRAALVVDVFCGGSQQDVAKRGWSHEDTLAGTRRDRQQDPVKEPPGQLVEDDELASARRHRESVMIEVAVDQIGVQA